MERLRLQIPEDMHKLLVDITLSLLDKSGYNRNEAEAAAAIVEKAEGKEYGGMFEVAIESLREEREEALAEGWAMGREKEREEIARNALAKGYSAEVVHDLTGLDQETIKGFASSAGK